MSNQKHQSGIALLAAALVGVAAMGVACSSGEETPSAGQAGAALIADEESGEFGEDQITCVMGSEGWNACLPICHRGGGVPIRCPPGSCTCMKVAAQ